MQTASGVPPPWSVPALGRLVTARHEADRTYAMGLAALRQAAELTQVELARRMGVTQAAISRMEQPHDLLLSTLNSYLQAIGGTARMIVRFADGHEAILDLGQLA
jgi:transcriptional regulator with XRE-family HTH domain